MTKKDYKLIADAIAETKRNSLVEEWPTMDRIAESLADNLAKDNPRFDSAKFLVACGFTP